jgi:hypothetical protein
MGLPDLPQRLNHWDDAGRRRRGRRLQGIEQPEPIRADLQGEGLTLLPTLGQAVVLDPVSIALEPDWRGDRAQPVRHNGGQIVQRGAQRLADQFEEMQVAYGTQHMRAVSALLAPSLDQAARLEPLKHGVQQQVLRLPRDQASAELGQHAEVEPRVGELKPERELPVDPGAHRVGRLAVAEMFEKLEDCDQGQAPRGQGGLTPARVKRPEVLVPIKDLELLAQPHGKSALGKGGIRDTRRLSGDLADRVRMEAHGQTPSC